MGVILQFIQKIFFGKGGGLKSFLEKVFENKIESPVIISNMGFISVLLSFFVFSMANFFHVPITQITRFLALLFLPTTLLAISLIVIHITIMYVTSKFRRLVKTVGNLLTSLLLIILFVWVFSFIWISLSQLMIVNAVFNLFIILVIFVGFVTILYFAGIEELLRRNAYLDFAHSLTMLSIFVLVIFSLPQIHVFSLDNTPITCNFVNHSFFPQGFIDFNCSLENESLVQKLIVEEVTPPCVTVNKGNYIRVYLNAPETCDVIFKLSSEKTVHPKIRVLWSPLNANLLFASFVIFGVYLQVLNMLLRKYKQEGESK